MALGVIFGSDQIDPSFQKRKSQHTLAANRKECLAPYCSSSPSEGRSPSFCSASHSIGSLIKAGGDSRISNNRRKFPLRYGDREPRQISERADWPWPDHGKTTSGNQFLNLSLRTPQRASKTIFQFIFECPLLLSKNVIGISTILSFLL